MLFGTTVIIATHAALLDSVQYEAARLVTGVIKGTISVRLYKELA